jgi:hypothetical protein
MTPASRKTLKWCVQVDLVTGTLMLPHVRPSGERGDDPEAYGIAHSVQNGDELDPLPSRMSNPFMRVRGHRRLPALYDTHRTFGRVPWGFARDVPPWCRAKEAIR